MLLATNCSFRRCFLQFKLGLPSLFCLRFTLLFLLAVVSILYLQNSNDTKSISKASKWTVFSLENGHQNDSNKRTVPSTECQRVFGGDKALVWRLVRHRRKIRDPPPDELAMSCEAILARHGDEELLAQQRWDNDDKQQQQNGRRRTTKNEGTSNGTTELERQMPMAFARVVYTDYLFLEAELLVHYAPTNWYCYVFDSKSSAVFQRRVRQLASCLPNVLVVDQLFDISSNGFNMNTAVMECVRTLSDERKRWKYLVTLQNHDVQAKTNAEMAQIFTWLGGANDVEVELRLGNTRKRIEYYQRKFNWTFEALHLFKDEAMNRRTDSAGKPLALRLSKGYMAVSLAREFVDFVVHELNVTRLLAQLNGGFFGMDEHFWQSLSGSESLDAPGGFPHECFLKGNGSFSKYKYITRFAKWSDSSAGKCLSGNWRHSVCVFGLEDLLGPSSEMDRLPHLFVNKLMPGFDFDAVLCWHQRMRQRRRSGRTELDMAFYMDWPQVRYQKERRLRKKLGANGNATAPTDSCESEEVTTTTQQMN
ncbi:hypothetical protein niasHT_031664 [Heterodera trifolii]|uniref:Uncharacterized protein n=1 Tax=Heterodera trifolii TaxID=157864 RepID=A0ABD2IXY8_9BILA